MQIIIIIIFLLVLLNFKLKFLAAVLNFYKVGGKLLRPQIHLHHSIFTGSNQFDGA